MVGCDMAKPSQVTYHDLSDAMLPGIHFPQPSSAIGFRGSAQGDGINAWNVMDHVETVAVGADTS